MCVKLISKLRVPLKDKLNADGEMALNYLCPAVGL